MALNCHTANSQSSNKMGRWVFNNNETMHKRFRTMKQGKVRKNRLSVVRLFQQITSIHGSHSPDSFYVTMLGTSKTWHTCDWSVQSPLGVMTTLCNISCVTATLLRRESQTLNAVPLKLIYTTNCYYSSIL